MGTEFGVKFLVCRYHSYPLPSGLVAKQQDIASLAGEPALVCAYMKGLMTSPYKVIQSQGHATCNTLVCGLLILTWSHSRSGLGLRLALNVA